jgi:hypothetical protein
MSHRTNPSFNHFYNTSRLQSKRTHAPPTTENPFRSFPVTPQPSSSAFTNSPFFPSKNNRGINENNFSKLKALNGITIINNNVNNYYQGMDRPQYSRQISQERNSDMSHIPTFSSTNSPSKYHLSKNKKAHQAHQKSVPSFLTSRKKMFSVHVSNNHSCQVSNKVS